MSQLKVLADVLVTLCRMVLALRDLFVLKFTQPKPVQKGHFGFLIHDRDGNDLYRWLPAIKYLPKQWQDRFRWWLWPIRVSKVTTTFIDPSGNEVEGWLLAVVLTAEQMVGSHQTIKRARKKIAQLFDLADRLGLAVVGLGAYSASITKLGESLGHRQGAQPTTGHAFTSAVVAGNAQKAADTLNLDLSRCVVGFAGAGSIGTTTAKIFSGLVGSMIIIDRSLQKAESLAKEVIARGQRNVTFSSDLHDLRTADIVIVATTSPEAILHEDCLKRGAVVVDDSQPRNINEDVAEQAGVVVIDGGVVYHHGVEADFDFGLGSRHILWGCLAETVLLASLNGQAQPVVGLPDLTTVKQLTAEAERLGMEFVLRSFNQPLAVDTVIKAKAA